VFANQLKEVHPKITPVAMMAEMGNNNKSRKEHTMHMLL